MTKRIDCPLRTCTWQLMVREHDLGTYALADVFGLGVMASASYAQTAQQTEEALKKHFDTHGLVEWVTEITKLKDELAALRST